MCINIRMNIRICTCVDSVPHTLVPTCHIMRPCVMNREGVEV